MHDERFSACPGHRTPGQSTRRTRGSTLQTGGEFPRRDVSLIYRTVEMALFGTIWHCFRGSLTQNANSNNELGQIKNRPGTLAFFDAKKGFSAIGVLLAHPLALGSPGSLVRPTICLCRLLLCTSCTSCTSCLYCLHAPRIKVQIQISQATDGMPMATCPGKIARPGTFATIDRTRLFKKFVEKADREEGRSKHSTTGRNHWATIGLPCPYRELKRARRLESAASIGGR